MHVIDQRYSGTGFFNIMIAILLSKWREHKLILFPLGGIKVTPNATNVFKTQKIEKTNTNLAITDAKQPYQKLKGSIYI